MNAIEQEILEKFRGLSSEHQQRVLEFVTQVGEQRSLSPTQLMQLPPEVRAHYIKASIESAAAEDFEIFEAYSQEMIHED